MNHREFYKAAFCPDIIDVERGADLRIRNLQMQVEELKHLAGELRAPNPQFNDMYPRGERFAYECAVDLHGLRMGRHGLQDEEIEYIASMHARRFKNAMIETLKKKMSSGGYL